jgi:hypothetical protein
MGSMTLLLFIILISFCFAHLEIQIEGKAGWAANLPTWRIEKHWLLDIFWGGRALTGYHFWAMSFLVIMFHFPLFLLGTWNLELQLKIVGSFILFWIIEDFLWFVLNPGYGIRKFKKVNIPWHPRWFLGMPIEYWLFTPIGFYLIFRS